MPKNRTKMKQQILFILLIIMNLNAYSQAKMRKVEELINEIEPGWELVSEWISSAKNKIEILKVDNEKAKEALYILTADDIKIIKQKLQKGGRR